MDMLLEILCYSNTLILILFQIYNIINKGGDDQ